MVCPGERLAVREPETTYSALWEDDFSWRHEERQSFDPTASVRMFRYDLAHFGCVLPETRERVQDEELSLIAEAVDRACRTPFILQRQGDDLVYFKEGRWQSYTGMLLRGIEVNKAEAAIDHRRKFLADAAVEDFEHGTQMRMLKPGEQHVWYSRYPSEIQDLYGASFMKSCGRFPDRQMGFLYRAYCNEAGNVELLTQTVDRSDLDAFEAAMIAAKEEGADMDDILAAYDAVLTAKDKHGRRFYAGRLNAEVDENVWNTILQHRDLIEYFLANLEMIARSPRRGIELEHAVKRHMYGTWAAFKQRIDGKIAVPQLQPSGALPIAYYEIIQHEVWSAFARFAREGRPLIGCGGKIEMLQGEDDILNAKPEDVFDAIFGKRGKNNKDCDYISKECPICHAKNVKTVDKEIPGRKGWRRISGACRCSKVYKES